MLIEIGAVVLGVVLLIVGGELLVRGASGIALLSRLTPTVVGLTVVSAGTSMPELVVSLKAAFVGSPALALGNAVGSNIFNLSAILGVAALVRPLRIQGNTVRFEWPVMMLSAFQLHLLSRDFLVDRLEGGFLVLALVAFIAYLVWVTSKNTNTLEDEEFESTVRTERKETGARAWFSYSIQVLIGIGLLTGGANVLVYGAVGIATGAGISETVIGLTVVAAGTSLPELAASAVAAFRGKDDLAVGNLVGSNIFNVLCICGTTSLVHPLQVPLDLLVRDNWWMLGLSALLFPVMRSGMRVNRAEGALLLGIFIALYDHAHHERMSHK